MRKILINSKRETKRSNSRANNSSIIQKDVDEVIGTGNAIERKSLYYRDSYLFRFTDGSVKICSDLEFLNEFRRRAND
jgi:hypothetical protein